MKPETLNELALFAGAGGGILGGKLLGWKTVCAVEWDGYARDVLVARQNDGCLDPFPIWDDVQTFDGKPWRGLVDVVSGGFPCQDISAAGKGAGIEGERSGMWKHMARIVGEVLPHLVFVENSPMLVGRGLAVVLADLAEMGYDAEWGVVGAHHVAAPHKRDRIWIVAYSNRGRSQIGRAQGDGRMAGSYEGRQTPSDNLPTAPQSGCGTSAVADASGEGLQGSEQPGALRDERDRKKAHGSASECGGTSRPAWMPCPCCDDWWCNIHGMHTGECPCPEIDEWETDPYVGHAMRGGLPQPESQSMQEWTEDRASERTRITGTSWWATEPDVGGKTHGVATKLDGRKPHD